MRRINTVAVVTSVVVVQEVMMGVLSECVRTKMV